MAYGSNQEEDFKKSEWNSASFKMKRLHDNYDLIGNLMGNLWFWNSDYGCYNFEIAFKKTENQFLEVDSKLTEEERIRGDELRWKIKIMIRDYQVYKKRVNMYYKKVNLIPNKEVMNLLEEYLFKFNRLVRQFVDDHGMDTSYGEEEGLF